MFEESLEETLHHKGSKMVKVFVTTLTFEELEYLESWAATDLERLVEDLHHNPECRDTQEAVEEYTEAVEALESARKAGVDEFEVSQAAFEQLLNVMEWRSMVANDAVYGYGDFEYEEELEESESTLAGLKRAGRRKNKR